MLNNYFIDFLPSNTPSSHLSVHLPQTHCDLSNSFHFNPITLTELYNILVKIKLTFSGPYDLSGHIFMLYIPHYTTLEPILHILNCSLSSGISPSSFRPISLSPFLFKFLERICFTQLNSFLTKKEVIPTFQSGFRRLHSITTALSHILDRVLDFLDCSSLSALIALDYSKAFNTTTNCY